ncbi:hypothetical protein PoB_007701300 [Plakobranchus ocellatus]|uniref:Uncharacterized protein n=1 Tax=Plakobranchus ocellatus TaxID=259542 RepID=A0AAV4E1S8_9GAST|nr:hypothetical protein PoB_007701300 [Plakobranchus ocellatus]
MAIVYVGVNVFFSMALSAVLSLIVLFIVQLHKNLKQTMGKLISRDSVTPLGLATTKLKDEERHSEKASKTLAVTKGGKHIKWADVRKRRPSSGLITDMPVSARTSALGAEPSRAKLASNDETSSRPTNFNSGNTHRAVSSGNEVKNKQNRPRSGAQISPSLSLSLNIQGNDTYKRVTSPAWDIQGDNGNDSSDKKWAKGEYSRKSQDGVVSPSSCKIDILSHSKESKSTQRSSVFDMDMKAYEIW